MFTKIVDCWLLLLRGLLFCLNGTLQVHTAVASRWHKFCQSSMLLVLRIQAGVLNTITALLSRVSRRLTSHMARLMTKSSHAFALVGNRDGSLLLFAFGKVAIPVMAVLRILGVSDRDIADSDVAPTSWLPLLDGYDKWRMTYEQSNVLLDQSDRIAIEILYATIDKDAAASDLDLTAKTAACQEWLLTRCQAGDPSITIDTAGKRLLGIVAEALSRISQTNGRCHCE